MYMKDNDVTRKIDNETFSEIKEEVLVATQKKIQESDQKDSIPEIIKKGAKRAGFIILRRIVRMILGIYHYLIDIFRFYFHNNDTLEKIYYSNKKTLFGYLGLNALVPCLAALIMIKRLISTNQGIEIRMYPTICQFLLILWIVLIAGKLILSLLIKIIELLSNHHNINYFSVLKALNSQSISLIPFIILFTLCFVFAYSQRVVMLIALAILINGLVFSYVVLGKALRYYHLVRKDRLTFLFSLTLIYSSLIILGGSILYFTNLRLIELIGCILF